MDTGLLLLPVTTPFGPAGEFTTTLFGNFPLDREGGEEEEEKGGSDDVLEGTGGLAAVVLVLVPRPLVVVLPGDSEA